MCPVLTYIQGEREMFQWAIYQCSRELSPSPRPRKQQAVEFISTVPPPYMENVS